MFLNIMSIGFGLLFLALLTLLHFLKRELDPKWRMISEYEIGKNGWLMRIAFFSWAASTGSFMAGLIRVSRTAHVVVFVWLSVIALCLIGAGIFRTDPIMEVSSNFRNVIHSVCGSVVILTFPIVATISFTAYSRENLWNTPGYLLVATVFTWIGLVGFFASIAISRRKDPTAGRTGPTVYLGWPNRIMVLFYVIWILVASMSMAR